MSFSNAWKWKVKVKSLNRVRLLVTPRTAAHQAPPSMGFSRQECWSGVPLPSLSTLSNRQLKKKCGGVCVFWLQNSWGVDQSLREGNGTPLQRSCLENPRDGGAWWAAVYGVTQSRTRLKWLSSSSSRPKSRRKQWHPTPLLMPGKSQGRGSLLGCSPWGR